MNGYDALLCVFIYLTCVHVEVIKPWRKMISKKKKTFSRSRDEDFFYPSFSCSEALKMPQIIPHLPLQTVTQTAGTK